MEIYLFQVKEKLQYPMKDKHEIIRDARRFMRNCMKEGDRVSSKEDLYTLFDTPEGFAEKFMELQMPLEENQYKKEQKIQRIFLIGLSTIISLVLLFYVCLYFEKKSNTIEHKFGTIDSTSLLYGSEENHP